PAPPLSSQPTPPRLHLLAYLIANPTVVTFLWFGVVFLAVFNIAVSSFCIYGAGARLASILLPINTITTILVLAIYICMLLIYLVIPMRRLEWELAVAGWNPE
ncbi:hypothetical protein BCR33DRAFT_711395, partial [Rhizoclosmatium globosum]